MREKEHEMPQQVVFYVVYVDYQSASHYSSFR